MMTKEQEMKISQMHRADSALREPKSALPRLMRGLGLTLLACTVVIGVAEAQQAAPPIDGVIGKLQSFDGKALEVQTPSGVVHVAVKEPLTTYKQIPSDLSHITPSSYVGAASTEQNGKQVAKQVFIFPPELSGAVEGSVLTDPLWNELSADPKRIDEDTPQHFAALYAQPRAMHDAFEQFGTLRQDAADNKALLAKGGKITMPVFAIGAEKFFG